MDVHLSTPTTKKQVRRSAEAFLDRYAIATTLGEEPLPIFEFLDSDDLTEATGCNIHIVDDGSLGELVAGEVRGTELRLTESTYMGLINGQPSARFNAVHELAHAILHQSISQTPEDQLLQLPSEAVPFQYNCELQADYWAVHALMPNAAMLAIVARPGCCDEPRRMMHQITSAFGVSAAHALDRLALLRDEFNELIQEESEVIEMVKKMRAEHWARLSANR